MKTRPRWMPETRQFSQLDPRIQQRPEGLDSIGAEGVIPSDKKDGNIEKYSELQISPGRWDEAFGLTASPQGTESGRSILIEKDLAFIVNSFLCDNWTNQWLYEPNLKRYIPPYSGGWIFLIPNGYQKARVELRAPAQYIQPVAIAGEFTWMGWHEAVLPPSTGILFTNPANISPSGQAEVVIVDDTGAELVLNTAAILGGVSATGSLPTDLPGEWGITSAPAVNTQASATRAAVGGTRHIATSFSADFSAGTVAPTAIVVVAVLRDGASGVGAILQNRTLNIQALIADRDHAQPSRINLVGTSGNAMTVEFTIAGGANTFETVDLTGYDAT